MLQQVRTVVAAVMGSLVLFAIVLAFALPHADLSTAPPLWLAGAQVAAGVAIHFLVETIGYRTPAIPPGTSEEESRTRAAGQFMARSVVRASLCELIALASVAAAFILESGGYVGYLTGGAVSLVLLAVHAWPGERTVARTMTSLERDGGRSYLREQLGMGSVGPIQEL
jgi:hypothetical protein